MQPGTSAHSGRGQQLEQNIFSPVNSENHSLWKLANYNELFYPISLFEADPSLAS